MSQVSPKAISVMIIDDHPLIRESLALALNSEASIKVIGSSADAPSGLKSVSELLPDVVLIDINMPGPSPFDGVRQLKEKGCASRFIFLSAYLTDSYLRDVLKSGAAGYLIKTTSIGTLAKAIETVYAGQTCYSPEVQERLTCTRRSYGDKGRKSTSQQAERTRGEGLTGREIEVLRYLARGFGVKQMAETMCLSSRTVDRHKANIMQKLQIHNQAGLVRYAIAEGVADIQTFAEPSTVKAV